MQFLFWQYMLTWMMNGKYHCSRQFWHKNWLKIRGICQSKFVDWSKSWKHFKLFDWLPVFQPVKFLSSKISRLNFWINRKTVINSTQMEIIHNKKLIEKYWSTKILEWKSSFSHWRSNYTYFRAFGALGQFVRAGPKYL